MLCTSPCPSDDVFEERSVRFDDQRRGPALLLPGQAALTTGCWAPRGGATRHPRSPRRPCGRVRGKA
eukprot:3524662-Alexandrium_andersonii.AAC.1